MKKSDRFTYRDFLHKLVYVFAETEISYAARFFGSRSGVGGVTPVRERKRGRYLHKRRSQCTCLRQLHRLCRLELLHRWGKHQRKRRRRYSHR